MIKKIIFLTTILVSPLAQAQSTGQQINYAVFKGKSQQCNNMEAKLPINKDLQSAHTISEEFMKTWFNLSSVKELIKGTGYTTYGIQYVKTQDDRQNEANKNPNYGVKTGIALSLLPKITSDSLEITTEMQITSFDGFNKLSNGMSEPIIKTKVKSYKSKIDSNQVLFYLDCDGVNGVYTIISIK